MKLNKVYYILFCIIPLLLGLYSIALCATDDSTLQVYTLTGDKMVGMTPEPVNLIDTQFSDVVVNALNLGMGLQTFTMGGDEGALSPSFIPMSMSGVGSDKSFAIGVYTSGEVCLRCYRPYRFNINFLPYLTGYSPTGAAYLNQPIGVYPCQAASSYVYMQLFNYAKLVRLTLPSGRYVDPALDITLIDYPTVNSAVMAPVSSTIWQNRLFVVDANGYLAYSAPANFENFTASATEGGIIKLQTTKAYSVVATDDMVYCFTDDGIFALYGNTEPSEWTLTKISENKQTLWITATIRTTDNSVYFINNKRELIKISSGALTRICKVPDELEVSYGATIISDRFIGFHTNTYGSFDRAACLFIYDIVGNTWSMMTGVSGVNATEVACPVNWILGNFTSSTPTCSAVHIFNSIVSDISKRNDVLTYIKTAWNTLDGSPNTRKHIRRVEFDVLWSPRQYYAPYMEEADKYYTELYYEYGGFNTKSTLSAPYLTFSVTCSKINKTVTNTFTEPTTVSVSTQPSVIRTFTVNCSSLGSAVNSLKFTVQGYGHITLKQIRVYYEPVGNYKNKGSY